MLSLSVSGRYFLYRHWADMRKGFDGLSGLVRNELQKDPLSGDVFIFFNKRPPVGRDLLRMLVGTCGPDQVEGINEYEGGLEALPGLGFADNGQAKHYSRTQRITSCTGNQIE